MYDPYYGWTWIDAAPWGWAPYHYGRWVHVSGYWGWAPGPVVVRPRYAPALVAFFGGAGVSVGLSIGAPHVGWLALGWGEPIVPWWGPLGVRGVPRWAGWGGPRVVNEVVVKRKTVIHVNDIRHYEHSHAPNAFVAVDRKHFGRRTVTASRIRSVRLERYAPLRGDLELRRGHERRLAAKRELRRPPRERRERPFVEERKPRIERVSKRDARRPPRERRERSSVTERKPRVERVSKREARRRDASSEHRKGRAREKDDGGERATPQEPPRDRSKRSREASRREERIARSARAREHTAPAEPQARKPKPRSKHTQLARADVPAAQAPRATSRRDEERRASRRESTKPARVESRKRDRARPTSAERSEEPARRVARNHDRRRQAKVEQAEETESRAKASRRRSRRQDRERRR
jgi:hypothetical protein